MSWSRRGVVRWALAPALVALAGCGFAPMYGRRGGSAVAARLAALEVGPIADRLGQILRNDLIDRLTPRGEPRRPQYRLRVEIAGTTTQPLAIQSDATITRYNLLLDVNFALIEARTGRELYRDRTRTIGSYNTVRSDFATLVAEQDTARRVAREASDEIHTLLGVFFARQLAAAG